MSPSIIVVFLAIVVPVVIYKLLKSLVFPSVGLDKMVCTACLDEIQPKKVTPGSLLIEISLYFLMILPGVIYSLWRVTNKKVICPACSGNSLVCSDSARGKQLRKIS